ncbi:hypothetical protein HNP84_007315 [Thermocatellispora tengchongensis]|uniref:Peptidoglycan recognition protein family domain-containing protein n=1 Tax=Thermocatellispora tengchongensis TaxID=1073253 RepID=A0A840PI38_9ACTN|nr:peptidoglycan-binding domain-containing protein [Thermocatellispora tengchongensis]MBB5137563.1 hypothetical protein [Thermocatellispora tengchongensis]
MSIDLVTRREWGARPARGRYDGMPRPRGVKIHYTGGRVDPAIVEDHDRCEALVRQIQKQHQDGNGWMDIGYTYACCPHRRVFVGRGPNNLPAANGPGLNSGHYAVLGLVGTSGLVVPPPGMLHGILDAIAYLRAHGRAGREIAGHRDGYATECPGDRLYEWIQEGAPRPGAAAPKPVPKVRWDGDVALFPGRVLEVTDPMMHGEDVETWQERMARRGWTIDVDGWYGPQSRTVCKGYQRATGLPVTGRVDRATWNMTWSWRPPETS